MPEPVVLLEALTVAGLVAAMAFRIGRRAAPSGSGWVWDLAVGLGFYLGLAVLGAGPKWPIREDQDRFLGLVMPFALMAEAVRCSFSGSARWRIIGRFIVATAVAPLILHGSSYVADLAGPGSAEWPLGPRWLIFGGLGSATLAAWSALLVIQSRSGSAVRVPWALAASLPAAGLVVMLSGYASGGVAAFPLAAALLGASLAAATLGADDRETAPGVGLIGLSSVLMMGTFFGRLRTADAVVLFVSPLLSGIPEVGPLSRLTPRFRTTLGVVLTACAGLAVTAAAWRRFAAVAAGL
jgi:hypothetical protein